MSRQTVREQLVTLFTNTAAFNSVLGYLPAVLGDAQTKVLAVYSRRSTHRVDSAHLRNDFYVFYLDVLVKRGNDDTHEDTLDSLHETVRSTVRTNIGNTNWSALDLEEASDCFHAEISGVGYRVERLTLTVKVTGS